MKMRINKNNKTFFLKGKVYTSKLVNGNETRTEGPWKFLEVESELANGELILRVQFLPDDKKKPSRIVHLATGAFDSSEIWFRDFAKV